MEILALNSGSSSLKYALYGESKSPIFEGKIEEITDHKEAMQFLLEEYRKNNLPNPVAIGHRIVHGGGKYEKPQKITNGLLDDLKGFIPLAPLHLPLEIQCVEAAQEAFPGIAQFACFDTSFHHHLPKVAQCFPLTKELFERGIRRYGFHGLSYEYICTQIENLQEKKVVIAHLGNGCSLAAVKGGKAFDTTMGFSPTGGVMMGTRCGDLDPGLIFYLLNEYSADELSELLNHRSGLLGISGLSSDMKVLLEDKRGEFAIDLFCYEIKKAIGAFGAAMGGIDLLVFTGGIGEHSRAVREKICEGLHVANQTIVIETCEELQIARNVRSLLGLN